MTKNPNRNGSESGRYDCNQCGIHNIPEITCPYCGGDCEPVTLSFRNQVISPQVAAELLAKNSDNYRNIQKSRVSKYAKEMKLGRWLKNGEAIKMYSNGVLADGQHRLSAVIESGQTVPMLVIDGIDPSVGVMDRQRPRTVPQQLKRLGIKNVNEIASMSRLAIMHEKGTWGKVGGGDDTIIDSEIVEFAVKNDNKLQDAFRASRPLKNLRKAVRTLSAAIFAVGTDYPSESETAKWFADALEKGCDLSPDEPVLHLRNRILSQTESSKMSPQMLKGLITLAWNKTVLGESCSAKAFVIRSSGPGKRNYPNEVLHESSPGQ